MIRILIVDDQNLIREGIKVLLEKASEIQIVGIADDGESALQKIGEIQPDVVLLDIDLPGIDGLAVAKKISSKYPQVKVIMLSSYENESYVIKSTESGAKGYLLKSVSSKELEWSIKLVHQGYSAFKSELLTTLTPTKKSQLKVVSPAETRSQQDAQQHPHAPNTRQIPNSFRAEQPDLTNMEALLTRNHIHQKYAKYAPTPNRGQKGRVFDNIKINRFRKTISSFEFKLLIIVISFSLGFLVFVALSSSS